MLATTPPAGPVPSRDLCLLRAERSTFAGPARFLADAEKRARVAEYLTDMAAPYGLEVPAALFGEPPSATLGHSYGEMAGALIESVVTAGEPVGLLVLAFSVHDLRPGRHTAAYLSHLTPGAPTAFAVCDQGSVAAFTGLRIAREYASSAGIGRVLLIAVEQSALPYASPAPLPSEHQGVAMLLGECATPHARVAGVRQHAGVAADRVADLAAADLAGIAAGRDVTLVLGAALAERWAAPAAGRVRMLPPGQPSTGVWSGLVDEFAATDRAGLVVAADYDPELGYLCLAAFDTGAPAS